MIELLIVSYGLFISEFILIEVRAQMPDVTALGVAMAAGQAKGIDVWDIQDQPDSNPTHTFLPTTTEDGKQNTFLMLNLGKIFC